MGEAVAAGLTVYLVLFLAQNDRAREELQRAGRHAQKVLRNYTDPLVNRIAERQRQREIEETLPEFLSLAASCLRASLTVRQAVKEAADGISGPLGEELQMTERELSAGIGLDEALKRLAARTGVRELRMTATALSAGARYGGDVATVAQALSTLVRRRTMLRREVMVLTSQARYSAIILCILPIAFFLLFPGADGRGPAAALSSPVGWALIALGLFLNLGGYLAMRRLADPERLW